MGNGSRCPAFDAPSLRELESQERSEEAGVASTTSVNVKQAVPFLGVTNMEASLRFYVDGLGFKMKHWWIPNREEDKPDGRIRWCWLELGDAAIMLQEFLPERQPKETPGTGASVCFMCEDASKF